MNVNYRIAGSWSNRSSTQEDWYEYDEMYEAEETCTTDEEGEKIQLKSVKKEQITKLSSKIAAACKKISYKSVLVLTPHVIVFLWCSWCNFEDIRLTFCIYCQLPS